MRALVLLMLCVVLLAVLQASYIVAEAKKHDGNVEQVGQVADGAEKDIRKQLRQDRKMRRKARKGDAAVDADAMADDEMDGDVNLSMPKDQPPSDIGGGRGRNERVGKEDRQAQREARKQKKEQARLRKEQRQANKKKNQNDEGGRAESKAARQEAKKAKKAEKKAARQQATPCTSEADCQQGECCTPGKGLGGSLVCKANRKPRAAGKKCITSCSCDGGLQCYLPTPAEPATDAADTTGKKRRRNKKKSLGSCVAASAVDLTRGSVITAAYYAAQAAESQDAPAAGGPA